MKKAQIKIAPSIFGGDFGHLADEARRAEDAGADYLHIDIMDGMFVPNLTLGPRAVEAINRATKMFLDVHLMIYNPYNFIERFVAAGADQITFHLEATEDVEDTLGYIRKCGIKAGLAFCPETAESLMIRYLDKCDQFLIMTVHPGLGGQEFLPEMLEKIRFIRGICDKLDIRQGGITPKKEEPALPPFDIQVDGGITDVTAKQCIEAGATVLVAGTYLYQAKDMAAAIRGLRQSI